MPKITKSVIEHNKNNIIKWKTEQNLKESPKQIN